jgi:hypothetical protein
VAGASAAGADRGDVVAGAAPVGAAVVVLSTEVATDAVVDDDARFAFFGSHVAATMISTTTPSPTQLST